MINSNSLAGINEQFANDEELQSEWEAAKMAKKRRLAQYVFWATGVRIDSESLFDIQIKRIHEYKRQLLNVLGVVYRYKKLKVTVFFLFGKEESTINITYFFFLFF